MALAAERVGVHGGVVEVLTADVPDLAALAAHVEATLDITHL
jgi:hypothetical protein